MKFVLGLLRRFAGPIAALVALEAAGAGLALLGPVPLQVAVDVVVQGKPLPGWAAALIGGAPPEVLRALVALSVAVAVLTQVDDVGASLLSTLVGERLILAFQTRMFAAALRLPLPRYVERGVADTLYRIECDAQTVQGLLLDTALPVFSALLTLAVMLAALLRLSPILFGLGLAAVPPALLAARRLRPALEAAARDARERESRALSVVQQALSALPAVKAFAREDAAGDRFEAIGRGVVRARLRVSWLGALLGAAIQISCSVGAATALYLAIRRVEDGRLTLGQALLALSYLGRIYRPVGTLGHTWGSMATQLAGLSRATSLLEEPPEVVDRPDAIPLARARGEITFDAVTFAYDDRRPVLDGASLVVAAGERVGFVGETGAGKTTLLSLLLRFYAPAAGRILLDGVDLRDVRLADLRRQLAVVFQETVLFEGTIGENIALGRPGAEQDAIEAAARAANLHDAIRRLPDGYATHVGDRGHALSGGERQRVGLARAFLRDAPILILDEPTSALDAATEAGVLDALGRLMAGRTVLTITHRERALDGCDKIVRIEDGKLLTEER